MAERWRYSFGNLNEIFLFQTTELFEKLAKEEPQSIECKEQAPPLDQILKIAVSDSSSASLRIPKVAKRPEDFKLITGYTSKSFVVENMRRTK